MSTRIFLEVCLGAGQVIAALLPPDSHNPASRAGMTNRQWQNGRFPRLSGRLRLAQTQESALWRICAMPPEPRLPAPASSALGLLEAQETDSVGAKNNPNPPFRSENPFTGR